MKIKDKHSLILGIGAAMTGFVTSQASLWTFSFVVNTAEKDAWYIFPAVLSGCIFGLGGMVTTVCAMSVVVDNIEIYG